MKILLPILLALCISNANAGGGLKDDKVLHLGVSFAIGVASGMYFPENKPLAFGVAMIPCVAKELIDKSKTGFSKQDLVADAIGAAIGVYTGGFIVSYNHRNNETKVSYNTRF